MFVLIGPDGDHIASPELASWPGAIFAGNLIVLYGTTWEDGMTHAVTFGGVDDIGDIVAFDEWGGEGLIASTSGEYDLASAAGYSLLFLGEGDDGLAFWSVNISDTGELLSQSVTEVDWVDPPVNLTGIRPEHRFGATRPTGLDQVTLTKWDGSNLVELAGSPDSSRSNAIAAYDGVVLLFEPDYGESEVTGDVTMHGVWDATTNAYVFASGEADNPDAVGLNFWQNATITWGVAEGQPAPESTIQMTLYGGGLPGTGSEAWTWSSTDISGSEDMSDTAYGATWYAAYNGKYKSRDVWDAVHQGIYARIWLTTGSGSPTSTPYEHMDISITGPKSGSGLVAYRQTYIYHSAQEFDDESTWVAPAIGAQIDDSPAGVAVLAAGNVNSASPYTLAVYKVPIVEPSIEGELGNVRRAFT